MIQGFLGIFGLLLLARLFCRQSRQMRYLPILKALLLQAGLTYFILNFSVVADFIKVLGCGLESLKNASHAGSSFVFGYLGGGGLPFKPEVSAKLFIFAFQALPLVIVVSALAMLLFHWNILPWIVRGLSIFFRYLLSIGGALGTCSAAKIFLSQTETPLIIKPYLKKMSRGELFSIMTLGMATTAGGVLIIYAMLLHNTVPNVLVHLISASLINIPGAIAISRLMVPHDSVMTDGHAVKPFAFQNTLDAIYEGTSQGLKLFLNIIAALIVFIALVHLMNSILSLVPSPLEGPLTLQSILGQIFRPIVWLMGVPWSETAAAGSVLGLKTVLNEMVAFEALANLPVQALSNKSNIIMTYALCGFANLSSIGIQIAVLGTVAPERKKDVVQLGVRALIAGTLASCLSGAWVGLLM